MSEVEYRDIEGFPGYRVGNDGSVWSKILRGGKMVAGQPLRFGEWRRLKPAMKKWRGCRHLYVSLTRGNGDSIKAYVHTLVLEAFVCPKPEGMECCHENDIADDNRLENLRWDTHLENVADMVKRGRNHRGERTPNSILTEEQVLKIRAEHSEGKSQASIAKEYGMAASSISLICNGTNWSHLPCSYTKKQKASKYKGVSPSSGSKKNPWRATVRVNRKDIKLGLFPTEEEAYEAILKYQSDSVI